MSYLFRTYLKESLWKTKSDCSDNQYYSEKYWISNAISWHSSLDYSILAQDKGIFRIEVINRNFSKNQNVFVRSHKNQH